jgi:hypothetical protein
MNTVEIKTKLHEQIEHSDEKLLKMIYAIIQEYNGPDSLEQRRLFLVEEERGKYISGEGNSYSWDEVKRMAITKERPDAI